MPENEEATTAVYAEMAHKGVTGDVNRAISGQTQSKRRSWMTVVYERDRAALLGAHEETDRNSSREFRQRKLTRAFCLARLWQAQVQSTLLVWWPSSAAASERATSFMNRSEVSTSQIASRHHSLLWEPLNNGVALRR